MVSQDEANIMRKTRVPVAEVARRLREFERLRLGPDFLETNLSITTADDDGTVSTRFLVKYGPGSTPYRERGDGVYTFTPMYKLEPVDIDEQVRLYEGSVVTYMYFQETTCVPWYSGWDAVDRVMSTEAFKEELMQRAWHPSRLLSCLDSEEAVVLSSAPSFS